MIANDVVKPSNYAHTSVIPEKGSWAKGYHSYKYSPRLLSFMNHLMIDIETTGVEPGCAILSVAAVPFELETGEMGTAFTTEIDHTTSRALGLIDEDETLQWWDKQDPEVRAFSWNGKVAVQEAIFSFIAFVESLPKEIHAWGNAPTFDLDILKYVFRLCGVPYPFNRRLERDFRTHAAFASQVKHDLPFEGKMHIPLDDARHQVKAACLIWQLCNKNSISVATAQEIITYA